ncbi:MAG: class I SAM-dependent methyltransferase, partial [Myxococcota bacterium]
GDIIATKLVEDSSHLAIRTGDPEDTVWASVMEHERLEVITYPFEWSRGMLADAAELELRIARQALADGWMTIDATPYNIQFVNSRPVHIDLGSFEPYVEGRGWIAYRQFCEMYLYPLLIGLRGNGSEHRVLLRGALGGIPASMCWSKLTLPQRLRPSLGLHVGLQSAIEGRKAKRSKSFTQSDLAEAGMSAQVIDKQISGLQKLLRRSKGPTRNSQWSSYSDRSHYRPEAFQTKRDFVVEVASSQRPSLVLDIGANDGAFSEAVAPFTNHVVAVDNDDAVIENFYSSLKGSGKNITPLVVDISDPAGGRGWANAERSSFVERVRPDLVLCLAVIHHLVISASIPPERVIGFLRSMDAEVILEIPSIDDPMVTLLLDQKTNPEDYRLRYNRDRITRALEREFITVRREEISTRTLLHLTPRP